MNLSLDTLRPERFERMTRRRGHDRVLETLDLALRLGFAPVKVSLSYFAVEAEFLASCIFGDYVTLRHIFAALSTSVTSCTFADVVQFFTLIVTSMASLSRTV